MDQELRRAGHGFEGIGAVANREMTKHGCMAGRSVWPPRSDDWACASFTQNASRSPSFTPRTIRQNQFLDTLLHEIAHALVSEQVMAPMEAIAIRLGGNARVATTPMKRNQAGDWQHVFSLQAGITVTSDR